MRLTAAIVEILCSMEDRVGLPYLSFFLTLKEGNASAARIFFSKTFLDQETVDFMIEELRKKEAIDEKMEATAKKAFSMHLPQKTDDGPAKNIFEHLKSYTGCCKQMTEKRKKMISKWLKKGFTENDFINVHVYFSEKWGKDPEMSKYIRPETLYNTKFPQRVEEANKFLEKIYAHKKEIESCIQKYKETYTKIFGKEPADIQRLSLSSLHSIGFWAWSGYSLEVMEKTVESSLISWSKNPALIPHISLAKIFDKKFPQRALASIKNPEDTKGISGEYDAVKRWAQEHLSKNG